MNRRLVSYTFAGLLCVAAAATAQSDEAAWSAWAERVREVKPEMSEEDMKRLWEFRVNHPEFEVDPLVDAWNFHKNHPEYGREELREIWQFHRAHPEIDVTGSLAEVWEYHKQHPGLGKDDVAQMWRLREQHGISRPHLADMWQYHQRNPAQSQRDFNRAYKKYQRDPEKFRNRHKLHQQRRNNPR